MKFINEPMDMPGWLSEHGIALIYLVFLCMESLIYCA